MYSFLNKYYQRKKFIYELINILLKFNATIKFSSYTIKYISSMIQ